MNHVDVLIAGAGPAGSSAAIWARRAGLTVMLLDRSAPGRDKCCGDGLTALALRELESLGLRPALLDSWTQIAAARVRTPNGRVVRLPLPTDRGQFAAVCRRCELDSALVELAASAGAEVRFGVAFDSFEDSLEHDAAQGRSSHGEGGHHSWGGQGSRTNDMRSSSSQDASSHGGGGHYSTTRVRLSDGTSMAARFVVGADGVYSAVRKALGIGPRRYRGDWHAFRGYVTASSEAARHMWVWFEPDLLPGYAWSFPLADGRVNLGFGVPRAKLAHSTANGTDEGVGTLAGSALATVWSGLTQRPHIAEVLGCHIADDPTRAWPIPARLGAFTPAAGRALLCGDAAAAADPLTGEGIGQALQMGRIAAASIARGGPPLSVRSRYVRALRAEFALDHRLAAGLSRVLAHERLAEIALASADLTAWTRRQFARWMFEDYPRAAVATPRRWRSGMLRPQGAFGECSPPVAAETHH